MVRIVLVLVERVAVVFGLNRAVLRIIVVFIYVHPFSTFGYGRLVVA